MKLEVQCPFCETISKVQVNQKDWDNYNKGDKPIQVALSMLSAEDREILINGTCKQCQKDLYDEPIDSNT